MKPEPNARDVAETQLPGAEPEKPTGGNGTGGNGTGGNGTGDDGTGGDLLRAVLPVGASVASWDELAADGATEHDAVEALWPGERAAAEKFSPKRRTEFAAVRACARKALADQGFTPVAIGRGTRGMPLFPPYAVGALTHTEGLRAAVIAQAHRFRSLGVDAEPHDPLPNGVLEAVSLPGELEWVRAVLADDPGLRMDKVLFSAKEATYKAWFPLTRRWLGFEDAEITFAFDPIPAARLGRALGARARNELERPSRVVHASGSFVSRILIDPSVADGGAPLTTLEGRWAVSGGYVTAGIAIAAPTELGRNR